MALLCTAWCFSCGVHRHDLSERSPVQQAPDMGDQQQQLNEPRSFQDVRVTQLGSQAGAIMMPLSLGRGRRIGEIALLGIPSLESGTYRDGFAALRKPRAFELVGPNGSSLERGRLEVPPLTGSALGVSGSSFISGLVEGPFDGRIWGAAGFAEKFVAKIGLMGDVTWSRSLWLARYQGTELKPVFLGPTRDGGVAADTVLDAELLNPYDGITRFAPNGQTLWTHKGFLHRADLLLQTGGIEDSESGETFWFGNSNRRSIGTAIGASTFYPTFVHALEAPTTPGGAARVRWALQIGSPTSIVAMQLLHRTGSSLIILCGNVGGGQASGPAGIVGGRVGETAPTLFKYRQVGANGRSDAFVAGLDASTGTLRWVTQFGTGGEQPTTSQDCRHSPEGKIVVHGLTVGKLGGTLYGNSESESVFLAELSEDGEPSWVTRLGVEVLALNTANDAIHAYQSDAQGNHWIYGTSRRTDLPGRFYGERGETQVYVAKLDDTGVLRWVTQLGAGPDSRSHPPYGAPDRPASLPTIYQGLTLLAGSRVLIVGSTSGRMPGTLLGERGLEDLFLAELDPQDGTLLNITQIGAGQSATLKPYLSIAASDNEFAIAATSNGIIPLTGALIGTHGAMDLVTIIAR